YSGDLSPKTLLEISSNSRILSVGYQDDVRPYFAISDVFILPSYREGFPNTVLQAGAMGLPCIVSNVNGCNEIIVEGENGCIVPPKNMALLEDAMLKLVTEIECFTSLKARSRELIIDKFEQKVVWDAILKE
ncbi:glycosyltransferase, partial [Alcaligenes nematophilus]|uniref:glycosyltransferase n=1 Tax=Alcaligenes nematophilus TaxID=2994643 RepID=UPI003D23C84E